jgi:hypothetical protein
MIEKLSIAALLPEIILLVMAIAIALIDLFDKSPRRHTTYVLSLMTLGLVAVLQMLDATAGETIYSFGNMVVSDPMGNWLKCFSTLAVMVTLVYGRPYAADRDMLRAGGELFTYSCSGGISADLFHKIVASAGTDAGVDGYISERLQGAPDHPMTIYFPEGEYLKGLVVVKKL